MFDNFFPAVLVLLFASFLGGILYIGHTDAQYQRDCRQKLATIEPSRSAADISAICK